jgi:hypothetical protein
MWFQVFATANVLWLAVCAVFAVMVIHEAEPQRKLYGPLLALAVMPAFIAIYAIWWPR